MKIIIEFDEAAGRLHLEYDGSHVAALGLLVIAESAIVKKGASEGLVPTPFQVRKIG